MWIFTKHGFAGALSALTEAPLRNDLAMTGEITIMGKVLGVGGVIPKIQAAIEARCKEVLVPKDNEREVHNAPDYMKDKIKVTYASNIDDVLTVTLLEAK
jgi:ATP-dependent Lon protease